MATSEFAKTIVKQLDNYAVVSNRIDVSELYVDSQLQEARRVLDSLRTSRDCWCTATWKGAHDGRCLRVRALWAKLQIQESNQIQEQEKSNV